MLVRSPSDRQKRWGTVWAVSRSSVKLGELRRCSQGGLQCLEKRGAYWRCFDRLEPTSARLCILQQPLNHC